MNLSLMTLRLEIAHKHSRERGFTLVASAICVVALFGAAGLAVDIGRMYITKNEAQSYADAAAVSADQIDDVAMQNLAQGAGVLG